MAGVHIGYKTFIFCNRPLPTTTMPLPAPTRCSGAHTGERCVLCAPHPSEPLSAAPGARGRGRVGLPSKCCMHRSTWHLMSFRRLLSGNMCGSGGSHDKERCSYHSCIIPGRGGGRGGRGEQRFSTSALVYEKSTFIVHLPSILSRG